MTYQEATQYLFNQTANFEKQGPSGYKVGMDSMKALDEHFAHPHQKFRTIHVAGTNGKGSVSHMLAAQLQVCGYRVGLYTSPHLVDFRERIRVNGHPISEDYVTKFVETEQPFFEPLKPTFFEITTAMAFKYFSEQDVDIAVIEVGLGGRMDSTNIITPILSIITNISLDHTQMLGATLEEIAAEKGGIIKEGVPCIIGEATTETRPVFEAIANDKHAKLIFAEDMPITTRIPNKPGDTGQRYRNTYGMEFSCELLGEFQEKNMNTIAHSLIMLMNLGYLCAIEDSRNFQNIVTELNTALMNISKLTGLQGRWQKVQEGPTVVCDIGHNPGAWQYLSKKLEEERKKCHELRIVYGILEDKDIYSIMSQLPKEAHYYWTKGSTKRAFPENSLRVFGEQFGLMGNAYPTVKQAFDAAMEDAQNDDFIFVGGSNYVVADFLKSRI
ncbi:MAG: bifunctional folylpolyglutamate synthase/dihydrofolate synthase [Prevotella sp.]|nr:bifunctional folylpolyglutamate synthase/dihydrofolate synthase [Prevotella sp.]